MDAIQIMITMNPFLNKKIFKEKEKIHKKFTFPHRKATRTDFETFMKEAANRPIHRVGDPEDVARAVLYLATELSSWVTGAALVVDGGGLA